MLNPCDARIRDLSLPTLVALQKYLRQHGEVLPLLAPCLSSAIMAIQNELLDEFNRRIEALTCTTEESE